jgi:hypothetical protein
VPRRLDAWLSQHASRPIVLGSPGDAPLVTDDHTFAVIGKTATTVTVIDPAVATPGTREVTVPLAENRATSTRSSAAPPENAGRSVQLPLPLR